MSKKLVFIALAIFSLSPWASSASALLAGIFFALFFQNPFSDLVKKHTPKLLSLSIIGLGAGINLNIVLQAGVHGLAYTAIGIFLTFFVSFLLRLALQTDANITTLITSGTAICGGSAIAAVSPVIGASAADTTVSLGCVFILNALALVIFPPIGHFLNLSQTQFGLWSALAIHDTSSVVGASMQFGPLALQTATTIKLARALWIIPLSLVMGWQYKKSDSSLTAKKPWFILGFLLASCLASWVTPLAPVGVQIALYARKLFVLVLFCIGSQMNRTAIASVGPRAFLLAILLWIFAASSSLAAIVAGWIQ